MTASVLSPYAERLLEARKSGSCISEIAEALKPKNPAEAYAIQNEVAHALVPSLGPVRGWKVGAPTPTAEPNCSPLHQGTLFSGDTNLPRGLCRFYGVEAEIVYIFGNDLPARGTPWTEAEVRDAIATAHAAIEIFDTRFCKPGSQDGLVHLADQGNHGALIYGAGTSEWRDLTPVAEPVRLTLNGEVAIEHIGGNSAGDPIHMLVWLANHAAARGLPIQTGTIVTSGSMIGTRFVEAGTVATVQIGSLQPISVTLP